ncbi:hypothetical protein OIU76_005338 [Salix suchowensis]|nr:hypothetical protein OIU76_005338 [Salix suchowensis]
MVICRSGVRHTNVLLRGAVFRTFSINFFTYGFPVSLFALSYWSLHFASICAFGLLAYVGYIVYAFPSVFRLHRLNGLLLVFILFWAVSTYIFNVAFPLLSWKLGKDMAIWDMGNLVNNSVFLYLSDEGNGSSNENSTVQEEEDTKVLIVATIAWGLRKCSRAIMLVLIFLIATKPGIIHAVYSIVQHTPRPPFGFSILKAGLNKSVLLSVYASSTTRYGHGNSSHESRIALFLGAIGQKFLSTYRSCGTYIAFLTILLAVYLVKPNYISFGYIFLLMVWIIGRQLVEKTKRRLWFPLKAYSVMVFVFIYGLSSFPSFEAWLSRLIDLLFYFGYNSKASPLKNIWESLAVLIVMQLYSYERRQSKCNRLHDPDPLGSGVFGFIKRFLIWHSQKILFIALFYASLSPISAFGFVYLLGLLVFSTLPKASRIPSKSFLLYTGFLVTTEYLFQMWGRQAEMFPGQKHSELSLFLGFRAYKPGFWGLESGLRAKVLVIAACTLQYNVFRWLDKMPSICQNKGKWEEPCPLFVSDEDAFMNGSMASDENKPPPYHSIPSVKGEGFIRSSLTSITAGLTQAPDLVSNKTGGAEGSGTSKFSFGYIWGSTKESHKWNKKGILSLKKERLETQKIVLKVYLKFWIENMFNLFGLEINMIALLLASFALLNAISMLYVALLAACILLKQHIIQKLWPVFVFLFASILVLEYFAIWKSLFPSNQHIPSETDVHCHDCWESSALFFQYCKNCWIGLIVDDPRMLISYFSVFMIACFKLRADNLSSLTGSSMYHQKMSQNKNTFVWKDLSFETKSMWTFLDYLRLYFYCHLLDLVLCLILITGTLEYDILHLGYLAFALVFFRMRLVILKKKNKVFRFLRIYNFALIVLSLAYQSPFVGVFSSGNFDTTEYLYEMTGFYKYDYGFRITARSALVEIIIFMLVSLQSYMFSSSEFDYVARYLEAEQIGAIVREQEKKASWKTAQLLYIRESEEKKRQRNLSSPDSGGLRKRKSTRISNRDSGSPGKGEGTLRKEDKIITDDSIFHFAVHESPSWNAEIPELIVSPKCSAERPLCEITEIEQESTDSLLSDSGKKAKVQSKENPLISAVQLIGDGVSQSDMSSDATSLQIGRIVRHIWSQMQSNNDVGPSYIFWVIMLMYTEVYILVQYVYQIIIQNCKMSIDPVLLRELGSSMSVKDGEWIPSTDIKFRRYSLQRKEVPVSYSWSDRAQDLLHLMTNMLMGIQPERIESGINQLLKMVHDKRCKENNINLCPFASSVHVQSIERSQENPNVALVVFEVEYASPLTSCASAEWHKSLTPADDVAKEILEAQHAGFVNEIGFPFIIVSVIGGSRREVDLYAYIFGADLSVFFVVAIFYQSVIKNKSEFLDVYQLEDQFPKEFVFILMIIFFLIVLDRIIYLCSFATGKLIFYIFNLALFTYSVTKLYRALPFLYELRCVLDWSCTTTSLTMYDWLKLEDIYASLYLVKCDAVLNRAQHKQGEKQTKWTKCCSGIFLFFILLCVIWAPMLIYSSGNPTNIANPIKDASVQIDIKTMGGRLTLYQNTLCEKLPWDIIDPDFDLDPHGYFDMYNKNDIQLICCQADASMLWLVPNVVQMRFIQSLDWDMDMDIIFKWVLTRDRPKGKEVVKYEKTISPPDLPKQSDIQKVLNGSANSFRTYNLYAKHLRVTGSGEVRSFEQEVDSVSADLVLNRADFNWWSFHDINSSDISGCGGLTGPMAVVMSDETPQGILGDTISKFSIWGLYITFVLAVGRFIRLQCSDLRMRIPYENLPSCDRLIAICEDIYAARAESELGVEEVLYWTLVKIYRSPHMLLEYTKPD